MCYTHVLPVPFCQLCGLRYLSLRSRQGSTMSLLPSSPLLSSYVLCLSTWLLVLTGHLNTHQQGQSNILIPISETSPLVALLNQWIYWTNINGQRICPV